MLISILTLSSLRPRRGATHGVTATLYAPIHSAYSFGNSKVGYRAMSSGAVIGVQLILQLGITPNTWIIGTLVAMLLERVPFAIFARYRSIRKTNVAGAKVEGCPASAAVCGTAPETAA